jgi:hypothetical protein
MGDGRTRTAQRPLPRRGQGSWTGLRASHATVIVSDDLRILPEAAPQWVRMGLPAFAGVLTVAGQRRILTCFPNIQNKLSEPRLPRTAFRGNGSVQDAGARIPDKGRLRLW